MGSSIAPWLKPEPTVHVGTHRWLQVVTDTDPGNWFFTDLTTEVQIKSDDGKRQPPELAVWLDLDTGLEHKILLACSDTHHPTDYPTEQPSENPTAPPSEPSSFYGFI